MKFCSEWQPVFVMIAIEFALAIVNVLLQKVIDQGMNHLVLIFYRTSIGAVFLAPIAYFWDSLIAGKSRPNLTAGILCYFFLSALMGATLTQYFFLLGIELKSATFACAFINMLPVITFVMALPFGLETVDLKSKAGKAKVMYHCKCWRCHGPHPLQWNSINQHVEFFSAIQSAALSLVINRDISVWVLKGKIEILTVVYTGIMGSGLSYVGMSWCVKKRGPLFTAAFSPLIQIIVAMFDFSILHEQLHIGSVLGSILVIIGLYILLWGKSHEAKASIAKSIQPNTDEEKNQASTS